MSHATLDLKTPLPISQAPLWVNALPCRITAGFPSPAEDHVVQRVDLMAQLMRHPQATYLLRVRGESMIEAGIFDNDVVMASNNCKLAHFSCLSWLLVKLVSLKFSKVLFALPTVFLSQANQPLCCIIDPEFLQSFPVVL